MLPLEVKALIKKSVGRWRFYTISRKPGDVTFIERQMDLSEENGVVYKSSCLFVVTISDSNDIKESRNKKYSALYKLKEMISSMGRTYIAYPLIDQNREEETNNMLEYVLLESGKHVTLHVVKNEKTDKGYFRKARNRTTGDNMVVVRAGRRTFADLLKQVKKSAKKDVEVKLAKKSRSEYLILVVSGCDKEEADKLRKSIAVKTCIAEVYTRVGGRRKSIHISDIEAVTTDKELRRAISDKLFSNENKVIVNSIGPAYGDTQKDTIEMEEKKAERLLRDRTVKIGWINCRVIERVQINRCYRCLEYGHTAPTCKEVDRKNDCRRCGKKGHMKKDCKHETDYCFDGKKEGYAGGSGQCPVFRHLLTEKKTRWCLMINVIHFNVDRRRETHELMLQSAR